MLTGEHFWRDLLSLLAAIGNLSLAATALTKGRKSALGRPLAAFAFAMFGWNFATVGNHLFGGGRGLTVLDSVSTALTPPLLVEFVLAFVGQVRRRRAARSVLWLFFGGFAAASAGALFSSRLLAWLDAPSWEAWFLVGWLPTTVFAAWLVVSHLRATTDAREKARARTVLAALAVGATFSTSDVAHGAGLPLPYLGAPGTLIVAALLSSCVVRLELFDKNVSLRTEIYVVGMMSAFVVAELVVVRVFATSIGAQAFGTAMVLLVLVAAARELGLAMAESRERVQRLAVLGRFSAQMTHDVRGPLTALLGAMQVLEGESDEKKRAELLDLAVEQTRRMTAIIDRYDRMARVEPRKTLVRINEIARAVARAHRLPDGALTLADPDLECEADAELLESALENVVRNAVEATKEGGSVRVETARDEGGAAVVRVIDTGVGMDARQRERAFEDFFTTKEGGSGLGLAFARRVMLAHGGDLGIESEKGYGTTVTLRLGG